MTTDETIILEAIRLCKEKLIKQIKQLLVDDRVGLLPGEIQEFMDLKKAEDYLTK